jgi:hypothetical protein
MFSRRIAIDQADVIDICYMDMAQLDLSKGVVNGNDRLGTIFILHVGGAPKYTCASYVEA